MNEIARNFISHSIKIVSNPNNLIAGARILIEHKDKIMLVYSLSSGGVVSTVVLASYMFYH